MDRLLKALTDPTRFRVLTLLLEDELTQKELRDKLGLDKATVSGHVDTLLMSGLVGRRSARGKCYVVRPKETLPILQAIADLGELIARDDALAASQLVERLRGLPSAGSA